jgi:hypothetical protein
VQVQSQFDEEVKKVKKATAASSVRPKTTMDFFKKTIFNPHHGDDGNSDSDDNDDEDDEDGEEDEEAVEKASQVPWHASLDPATLQVLAMLKTNGVKALKVRSCMANSWRYERERERARTQAHPPLFSSLHHVAII